MADFKFRRRQRPIRFTWRMDGEGHLLELSKEFEMCVGPQAPALIDKLWHDLLHDLNMDDAGQIATALKQHESFTGAVVDWPICNSRLRVPISLSAHAIFDDEKELLGFNGFGVIHSVRAYTCDSVVDPLEIYEISERALPVSTHKTEPETEEETLDLFQIGAQAIPPADDTSRDELEEDYAGLTTPAKDTSVEGGALGQDIPVELETGEIFEEAQNSPEEDVAQDNEVQAEAIQELVEVAPLSAEVTEETAQAGDQEVVSIALTSPDDSELPVEEEEEPVDTPALSFEEAIASLPDAPARKIKDNTPRSLAELTSNIVRFIDRKPAPAGTSNLSKPEKDAFERIAKALGKPEKRVEVPAPTLKATHDVAKPAKDTVTQLGSVKVPIRHMEQDSATPQNAPLAQMAPKPKKAPRNKGDKSAISPIDPRLMDRLPIGVAIVRDREIFYANDTLLSLLDYETLSDLDGSGGLEAIFAETDKPVDLKDETIDRQVRVRKADGTIVPADARMHCVPWEGGNALMISLSLISSPPLSTRKKATAEKRQEPEQSVRATAPSSLKEVKRIKELEAILSLAVDGVLTINSSGEILSANLSAEALLGVEEDELISKPFTTYLMPESHDSAMDYVEGLSSNGISSILRDGREVLGKTKNGSPLPLFMTMGRIEKGNNGPLCVVLRNIKDWKDSEAELTQARIEAEQASTQKSEFLSEISHEVRTPLNAIIGFAQVMLEDKAGAMTHERYRGYLHDIERSGQHIMSLINDLLNLAKIESGKMDLNFEAVSLSETLGECIGLMQPQASQNKIIVRTSQSDQVPPVVADARMLRQILLNILSNAITHNTEGGQVIASLQYEPTGEVKLRVRDTGVGMSEDELAIALEPFRQLGSTAGGEGAGLGLPLTKAMAEANRANFSITSQKNQGTLVEITFPSQRVLTE
ncbi:PAS domain-containing sensor histidine kinase [Flexibacterium corallicola]|uniref:PAS domain-containing sensor histidine kinase n=1 Tax=Flexibacterium corallicola TaxID=3037259 RepID=UPI00286F3E0C|nr:PAS domain-containing sensor histidine kinase [Pseudovibrio sp. M1P-2-3]